MMGRQGQDQVKLFYEFCLEDRVPANHLLRKIDRFVDLSTLRLELTSFYSPIGRPSIDPELMIRMLVVGYCFGIRSERQLCEEVHLNLAHRWFCRLGLEGHVPDHSTFSKTGHGRFRDSNAFRRLFELVVQRAIAEGVVGGEGFAVDASLIAADANKQRSLASTDEVNWQELAATRRSMIGISPHLMRPPGVPRARLFRSSSRRRTLPRSGRARKRARLLRLCRQLPDRPQSGDHRRC